MIKLVDLNPQWVDAYEGTKGVGIAFDCPCGNSDEEHRVYVSVDPPIGGGPPEGRAWKRTGDTFDTLTLTPSIQRASDCKWHGFVTNGEVTS